MQAQNMTSIWSQPLLGVHAWHVPYHTDFISLLCSNSVTCHKHNQTNLVTVPVPTGPYMG